MVNFKHIGSIILCFIETYFGHVPILADLSSNRGVKLQHILRLNELRATRPLAEGRGHSTLISFIILIK